MANLFDVSSGFSTVKSNVNRERELPRNFYYPADAADD